MGQMYHTLGNVVGTLTAACQGSVAVYPANKWDTEARFASIDKEMCTKMFGPPYAFIELLKRCEEFPQTKAKLATLKEAHIVAAAVNRDVIEDLKRDLNVESQVLYGKAEATCIISTTYLKDKVRMSDGVPSTGRILKGNAAKILTASGEIAPVKTKGELLIKGSNVASGYKGDPSNTERTFARGHGAAWFKTGDMAEMDEHGFLTVYQGVSEACDIDGHRVLPSEVGNNISRFENITDVKKYCETHMQSHQIPTYWKIMDTFPTDAQGRIKKSALQELAKIHFHTA